MRLRKDVSEKFVGSLAGSLTMFKAQVENFMIMHPSGVIPHTIKISVQSNNMSVDCVLWDEITWVRMGRVNSVRQDSTYWFEPQDDEDA